MTGYQLLTPEQREELDNLWERAEHSDTMRFDKTDRIRLDELEDLAQSLEAGQTQ